MRGFFGLLWFLATLQAYAGERQSAILLRDSTVRVSPSTAAASVCGEAVRQGTNVELAPPPPIDHSARWAFGQANTCFESGWFKVSDLLFLGDFKRVVKWLGPPSAEVEEGDWSGTIDFSSGGTFTLEDAWGSVTHGIVLEAGDYVWAQSESDMGFVLRIKPDGSICQIEQLGCAP